MSGSTPAVNFPPSPDISQGKRATCPITAHLQERGCFNTPEELKTTAPPPVCPPFIGRTSPYVHPPLQPLVVLASTVFVPVCKYFGEPLTWTHHPDGVSDTD